jgi:hypothetical protein
VAISRKAGIEVEVKARERKRREAEVQKRRRAAEREKQFKETGLSPEIADKASHFSTQGKEVKRGARWPQKGPHHYGRDKAAQEKRPAESSA